MQHHSLFESAPQFYFLILLPRTLFYEPVEISPFLIYINLILRDPLSTLART
jgi:hypothetical protein